LVQRREARDAGPAGPDWRESRRDHIEPLEGRHMTMHLRNPALHNKIAPHHLNADAVAPTEPRLYARVGKRALDLALVALLALPALLIVLPLAALIACDGGAPFYRQQRIGRNGARFRMWKLRTMVRDADERLKAQLAANPAARAEWDRCQKLRNDPRITPIGRIMRKTSMDELPQLLNVLRGEMSMVGPRPMMPAQRALYPGTAYYALRPGITGAWQTSERNETSFAERARFDTAYARDLSFGTDLALVLRTVNVVLKGTGC
jgi:lipopolysaccharide/colanic/teichoic acid biosynthesis glycosyltransferase